jgi:hypothetical protein
MSEGDIRAAFAIQAAWCRRLGATFTADLCVTLGEVIDRSTAVGARVLDWPGDPLADALVLRLTGGLNGLVRAGGLPDLAAFYPPQAVVDAAAFARQVTAALADDRLLPWLNSPPQTNEVARSAVLMPGLLVVAAETGLPLRLFELGASAGINLRLDHYRYDFNGVKVGPDNAPVTFSPDWCGPPPPDARVIVVARRGVDLMPIDASDADRLLAYVWPEQTTRVTRLSAALAAFVADPVVIDAGDAAAWVEANVAVAAGTTTVVFHSIAFQYFPAATQARIAAHLASIGAAATASAPLAWLRFEMDAAASVAALPTLRLTLWPGGEERLLARAHPHGASVEWLG